MLGEIASIASAVASTTSAAIAAIRGRKARGRPLFGKAGTGPLSALSIAEVALRVAELSWGTSLLLKAIEDHRFEEIDDLWSSWTRTLDVFLKDIRTFNWYILNVYYPATSGHFGRLFWMDTWILAYHIVGGRYSRPGRWLRQIFRHHRSTKNILLELHDDLNELAYLGYCDKPFPLNRGHTTDRSDADFAVELRALVIALNDFESLLKEIIRSHWTLSNVTPP